LTISARTGSSASSIYTGTTNSRNNKTAIAERNAVLNDSDSDRINDRINGALTEIQKQILSLIAADPHITAEKLAEKLGINERNTRSHIKALREVGILTRIGARKNGYWEIVG
jgi:ATP-dependent DNA helicase RecG